MDKKEINKTEEMLARQIYEDYVKANINNSQDNTDFENNIAIMENKRAEKEQEWMSNVSYPEYATIFLTEYGLQANQYFQTRDFINAYLDSDKPGDKVKARLATKLVNSMLNVKDVYHFQKYMRARSINSLSSNVYAICWWDKKYKQNIVGYKDVPEIDKEGNYSTKKEPIIKSELIKDHFNYEVYDRRNVFESTEYSYTAQDKQWIIFRDETDYETLKSNEQLNNYFNLDTVKEKFCNYEAKNSEESETSKNTFNKDTNKTYNPSQIIKFDRLIRFGEIWAVVEERDADGYPIKIKPGIDDTGVKDDKAEVIEGIVEIVFKDSYQVLIRFQATPFLTSKGLPYRNVIRGLCYIHPTKDTGMSDAKYAREFQMIINDTLNMSIDGTKLSLLPVFKGSKYSLEDNDSVYIEPEHTILLDNPSTDLEQLEIKTNQRAALEQIAVCKDGMERCLAVFPPTMGGVPEMASTTATAVAGAATAGNIRQNSKSLTFEFTFLNELYWMILQMAHRYMSYETALKIFNEGEIPLFDPEQDYTYKPVSSNIETTYNKRAKNKDILAVMQVVVNIPNPKMPILMNRLLKEYLKNLDQELVEFGDDLLDENTPPPMEETQAQQNMMAGGGMKTVPEEPMSNQNNVPMQDMEMMSRGM